MLTRSEIFDNSAILLLQNVVRPFLKNGELMTTFSPKRRPDLSPATHGVSSVSELDADDKGKEIVGIITRTRPEVRPAGVTAHRPAPVSAPLSQFSGSILRAFTLVVACVALLLATLPATSQMTGDLELALKMQKSGKLRDAIEVYSEVIKKNPKSAEAYNWRGIAYDDLGQMDMALQDFSKAIEISPNYADAYNNRGEIYRKKKMYREAFTDYHKATQLEPNFAEAQYNLGMVNEFENRLAPAAASYESYLKCKPDAADKSEIEAKIKTLRQAAAAQQRPGSPPVAQKPGEPTPPQPQAAPRPTPASPGGVRPPVPAKPVAPKGVGAAPPGMPGAVEIPGLGEIPVGMLTGIMTGMGILGAILPIVLYLFLSFMLFLIAKKTNTGLPWLAFIPIAQLVLALNIAGKPLWWLLLFLAPVASAPLGLVRDLDPTDGIIVMILTLILVLIPVVVTFSICVGIARARGKSPVWGVLLFLPCVNLIALAYLGLSD
jgi:Tfp pilus assembly protein PilF